MKRQNPTEVYDLEKSDQIEKNPANTTTNRDLLYEQLRKDKRLDFITFHPSYSYEEFVEGITVDTDNKTQSKDQLLYIRKCGIFKKMCTEALANAIGEQIDASKKPWEDQWDTFYQKYKKRTVGERRQDIRTKIWEKAKKYVLVIDEINRGDISKILGELVTLLESDKRLGEENQIVVQLPYSNDEFGVPPNLYLIGTMNTADRSISMVDVALRRRFGFVELPPRFDLLKSEYIDKNKDKLQKNGVYQPLMDSIAAVEKINKNIVEKLTRDKQIGHSFFFKVHNEKDLIMAWQYEILPLIEEYYYCNYNDIIKTLDIPADNEYLNQSKGIVGFKNIQDLNDFLSLVLKNKGS